MSYDLMILATSPHLDSITFQYIKQTPFRDELKSVGGHGDNLSNVDRLISRAQQVIQKHNDPSKDYVSVFFSDDFPQDPQLRGKIERALSRPIPARLLPAG